MRIDPRHRLIVALDVESVARAEELVERLGDSASFYKIGYELAFSGGLALAGELIRAGKKVFLDMKLHDIGATVHKGVEAIARIGATFVTVHGYPQTMRAAAQAARQTELCVLAVSVLTSYDEADLQAAGYEMALSDLVLRRALQARDAGVAGLVLSPREVAAVRQQVRRELLLVTPGIRPSGAVAGDQKRVATPAEAMMAGADYLVVGRPITSAPDPKHAAEAIQDEIASVIVPSA